MKLIFTLSAQKDLSRLREFIAEKNPEAAKCISQELKKSIKQVTEHPDMDVDVEGLPGVQDLVRGDYVVRYTVLESTAYVLLIWYGKEDR